MYELTSAGACSKARNMVFPLSNYTEIQIEKAISLKKRVNEIFNGTLNLDDLEEKIKEDFGEMPYESEKTKAIHISDSVRQITRYINSEKRKPEIISAGPLEVAPGFRVNPGLLYIFRFSEPLKTWKAKKSEAAEADENGMITSKEMIDVIEAVRLRIGKPDITQNKGKNSVEDSLQAYSILKYAEMLAEPGKTTRIMASMYFLRKSTDSNSTVWPKFDSDFFDRTGGNIVSLTEDYTPGEESAYDKHFEPIVQEFLAGIEEDACRKEDCQKCDLFDVCKFSQPPIAIVKTPVVRSIRDIELSKAQEEAIEIEDGIYRINAGAGAGKTLVNALHTVTLLNKGVKPEEILLITFTRSGAEEMLARVQMYNDDFGTGEDISKMRITTFNAFCYEIVKTEYDKFGFTAPPTVIDNVERYKIIADILKEHEVDGLDYRNFSTNMPTCKGALAIMAKAFQVIKKNSFTESEYQYAYNAMESDRRFMASPETMKEIIRLYDLYDEKMRAENLIEFSDQMLLVRELVHKDPFYLEGLKIAHIVVDEFQDTDADQIELLKDLIDTPSFKSLMVIGDDSQAIFGFRDTSPKFIIKFEEYIGKPVKDIDLVYNHRSTPEIIESANKLNEKNFFRVIKDLVATRAHGKPVEVNGFITSKEEQEYVIQGIKDHLQIGFKPEDIAVICATKTELLKMAGLLQEEGIPSVMMNPENLCENSRVRAAISLAKYASDTSDTKDLFTFANAKLQTGGISILDVPDTEKQNALDEAAKDVSEMLALSDIDMRRDRLIELLIEIDPYEDEVYRSMIEKLQQKNYFKVLEYLNNLYVYGQDEGYRRTHDYPGVVLVTAHSSKGLEWPIVYAMISKYDSNELHVGASSLPDQEEKRRLLFVTWTRARDELYVTGQYVAYSKKTESNKKDYHYNTFLLDSFDVVGKPITEEKIALKLFEREQEKAAARKKAKAEAAAAKESEKEKIA